MPFSQILDIKAKSQVKEYQNAHRWVKAKVKGLNVCTCKAKFIGSLENSWEFNFSDVN